MAFFGVNDASSVGTLFSSLNNRSKSGAVNSTNVFAEHASIRSGSYFKLLKTYYGSEGNFAVSRSEERRVGKEC